MVAKDYRQRAWGALRGNWGTVVITYLVYCAILGVCGALASIGVGAVLVFVLDGPLRYGLDYQALSVARGEPASVNDILVAKDRFADVFLAYLINSILIMLWSLLFIIPGIIQAYSYSMTFHLMRDNPKLKPDEARRESDRLMEGHKWELFCLHFSFIGWILLCSMTAGILALWVVPYMQCATAEFYETLIPSRAKVEHIPDGENDSDITPFDSSEQTVDPLEHSEQTAAKPDEPFYVFEEEIPRETTLTGDSINPNKKPKNEDK